MQDTVKVDREHYIGGSDIPVIMNLSPFKTRYQLLREKAGLEESEFSGNAYTEYGNKMEAKIRNYINEKLGLLLVEGKHYAKACIEGVELADIGIRCHTDGEDDDTILEVKTTSQIYKTVDEYQQYLSQLLFYMNKADKKKGILAVYERPEDMSEVFDKERLQIFDIKIEDYTPTVDEILKEVEKFLKDRQLLVDNPFLTEEELLPVDITKSADAVLVLEQKLAEYKALEKEYKKQKDSLLKAMQNANVKTWRTTGGYLITVVDAIPSTTKTVTTLDENALKEKHPRIYKQFSVETTITESGKKAFLKITAPKGKENG